jgi:hypothetical protein
MIECPRCANYGYALTGLSEARCPECGAAFDPQFVHDSARRVHLLPWERLELGGRVRRLLGTIVLACLHPGRYIASAAQRKECPVANPGQLIVAGFVFGLIIQAMGLLLCNLALFAMLRITYTTIVAAGEVRRAGRMTMPVSAVFMLVEGISALASVLVIVALLRLMFRRRAAALSWMSLAALLSPVVPVAAIINVLASVLTTANLHLIWTLNAARLLEAVLLFVLVWFCCRRVMRSGRGKAALVVILCGAVRFVINLPIESALLPLALLE